MSWPAIAPADLPEPLATERFVLVPLGPEHNDRDHAAWMSSIAHIRSTPGFADGEWGDDRWPFEMTADMNLGDLQMHADEFRRGEAYAYSVLDPDTADVIGCVYIDPDDREPCDQIPRDQIPGDRIPGAGEAPAAMVRSWVRASHASLDASLAGAVNDWLQSSWPFAHVRWPGRELGRTPH